MILRGDVFYIEMPTHNTQFPHCCEKGIRPCVVVSSNVGNRTSRVILVCPITTKIKTLSCNVNISWTKRGQPSQVLCNNITSVPVEQLTGCEGHLTGAEMKQVDVAILKSLGIIINYDEVLRR